MEGETEGIAMVRVKQGHQADFRFFPLPVLPSALHTDLRKAVPYIVDIFTEVQGTLHKLLYTKHSSIETTIAR